MQHFLDGQADVLVTTTIVESGLDVATANTLIVDRSDAMGLAQLYQLRGRIGRSTEQAYAYLFAPLGATVESQKRLEALMDFTELGSGFAIAMRDLEIRGAGNLLGAEQSGHIAAVGFEMYLTLLEEAVAAARGEPQERREERPVIVELTLDAYLPPGYVMDEIERVDLYRRASGLGSLAEVEDLAEELVDRFGALPEPARNLLGLSRVKLLAREVGASSVHLPFGQPHRHRRHGWLRRPRPHKEGYGGNRHDEDRQDIGPRPRVESPRPGRRVAAGARAGRLNPSILRAIIPGGLWHSNSEVLRRLEQAFQVTGCCTSTCW